MKALIFVLLAMLVHMFSTGTKDIFYSFLIGVLALMLINFIVGTVMYFSICFILKKGTDEQIQDLIKAIRSDK